LLYNISELSDANVTLSELVSCAHGHGHDIAAVVNVGRLSDANIDLWSCYDVFMVMAMTVQQW